MKKSIWIARVRGDTSAHSPGTRHVNVSPVALMSYMRVCRLKTRLFMKCARSFDSLPYLLYAFDEVPITAASSASGECR